MATELLEIQPRELRFTFELKKQSSCLIQLSNKSDQYVAFKVKTTSPKKYCVRPNTGIVRPKATCDFTVTMQAQRIKPPDMQCKDKFLIQCTVVPFGATEEDITSDAFAKDSGKYIEEKKLRVVLVSPPQSPVLLPINGELKQDPFSESPQQKDRLLTGVENIPPPQRVADAEGFETTKETDVLRAERVGKDGEIRAAEDVEIKAAEDVESRLAEDVHEMKAAKDVDETKLAVHEMKVAKDVDETKLAEDFEELKSKFNLLDSKLREAEFTIVKLSEERTMTTREKNTLMRELEMLRQKNGKRRVQVGFPLLYVFTVALISLVLGYLIHP